MFNKVITEADYVAYMSETTIILFLVFMVMVLITTLETIIVLTKIAKNYLVDHNKKVTFINILKAITFQAWDGNYLQSSKFKNWLIKTIVYFLIICLCWLIAGFPFYWFGYPELDRPIILVILSILLIYVVFSFGEAIHKKASTTVIKSLINLLNKRYDLNISVDDLEKFNKEEGDKQNESN